MENVELRSPGGLYSWGARWVIGLVVGRMGEGRAHALTLGAPLGLCKFFVGRELGGHGGRRSVAGAGIMAAEGW